MHLVEAMALAAGAKIDKISIEEKLFPLPFDGEYVTVHTTSKPSKTYDYWEDVFDIVKPILDQLNIRIVQIGGKGEKPLKNALNLTGSTSYNQVAYLIRNAKLHIGVDSFTGHLAGHYKKPAVIMYSNNYVNCVNPYFGDFSKMSLLEPDRAKFKKPSFSFEEHPKTINTIEPETIAKAILSKLDVGNVSLKIKTIFTGAGYLVKAIDFLPDQPYDIKSLNIHNAVLRMDYLHNEDTLVKQCQIGPVIVICNKPISLLTLEKCKNSILDIFYIVEDGGNYEFVNFVKTLGLKLSIVTYSKDEKVIKSLKFKYCELGPIIVKNRDKVENFDESKRYAYKTSKLLLANGKFYPSKAGWLANVQCDPNNLTPFHLINSEDFWTEKDNFLVMEIFKENP